MKFKDPQKSMEQTSKFQKEGEKKGAPPKPKNMMQAFQKGFQKEEKKQAEPEDIEHFQAGEQNTEVNNTKLYLELHDNEIFE
jgi:hypothetical protein